jgi:hypothetical protein
MASHRDSRQKVTQYLVENGPLDDIAGKATSKLRDAISYEGTATGFTQLLAAMERSGEISRSTKGKRTYRIQISETNGTAVLNKGTAVVPSGEQDYDQIAAALLVRVVETITTGADQRETDDSWARRRIERLERRNTELERALSQAKGETRVLSEERDELKKQLEHTAGNLALLTDRLESRRSTQDVISNRMGDDERALLNQLRSGAPSGRSNRVS